MLKFVTYNIGISFIYSITHFSTFSILKPGYVDSISKVTIHKVSKLVRNHIKILLCTDSTINSKFSSCFSKMKIGTHNGPFHADEALAIHMLLLLPEFKGSEIIRTRDPQLLDTCDILVDVGGVYDVTKNRYDHHQREFNTYFAEGYNVTKLSSAGLIYKHFAKRIFREVYGVKDEETVEHMHKSIYRSFIESMDAIDNGVSISDGDLKYVIKTDLSTRVSRLNPSWINENPDYDAAFLKAVKLVGEEFEYFVSNYINDKLPAKEIVTKAIENRFNTHKSGKVIEIRQSCPLRGLLHAYEEEHNISEDDKVLFYLFHDKSNNNWRSTAISDRESHFKLRLPFPEHLRGLRDAELEKESNIPGLVFVHSSGFTCGGRTKESVLRLIDLALSTGKKQC